MEDNRQKITVRDPRDRASFLCELQVTSYFLSSEIGIPHWSGRGVWRCNFDG